MKNMTTTKKIVGTAMFATLAFVVSFIEFPIFPAAGFLKLDFSGVFLLLSGFIYGPIAGVLACVVKELLRFVVGSSTGGVGEIANFIINFGFIIVPTLVYRFKKGLPLVILTLTIGCFIQTGLALLVNRYINFPLYMGVGAVQVFKQLWVYVLFFNLIKSVSVSLVTVLLYKRISGFIKSIGVTAKEIITKSEAETLDFAYNYAKRLKKGDVVLLSGDLGAGKTVFVKGVCKRFNILDQVTSPTYAYLNVYGDFVYHYDCYRLSSGEDANYLGLTDYFGKDNVCLIEWSENISSVLPKKVKKVTIIKIDENTRKIIV